MLKTNFRNQATLEQPNGSMKGIRNLGWLLRTKLPIMHITVNYSETSQTNLLTVYFYDGHIYRITFHSRTILERFLQRPKFQHIIAEWS